jgi:hypothetical protein
VGVFFLVYIADSKRTEKNDYSSSSMGPNIEAVDSTYPDAQRGPSDTRQAPIYGIFRTKRYQKRRTTTWKLERDRMKVGFHETNLKIKIHIKASFASMVKSICNGRVKCHFYL